MSCLKSKALIHILSEHSLGRGSMTLKELFQKAVEMGVDKVILTEYQTLSSGLEAYSIAKEYGISLYVGLETNVRWQGKGYLADGSLLLLPKDEKGRLLISKILSDSYKIHMNGEPCVNRALLEQYFAPGTPGHNHVIVTTAGMEGLLFRLYAQSMQRQTRLREIENEKKTLLAPDSQEWKRIQENVRILREKRDSVAKSELNKAYKEASQARKQIKRWRALEIEKKQVCQSAPSENHVNSIAQICCDEISSVFGYENFYVELCSHGSGIEKQVLPTMVNALSHFQLMIADEARYARKTKDDFRRQQLMEAISPSSKGKRQWQGNFHIQTIEQISEALRKHLPENIIANALAGRERLISSCIPAAYVDGKYYPRFPDESGEKRIIRLAHQGIERRFPHKNGWTEVYSGRLEEELEVIIKMGFADYFCIVEDLIGFARRLEQKNGAYYVGPGRGSAVGSLTCYLLGITSVDPVKENLLFTRFLNESRVTAPDIDTDIAPQIYEKVLSYAKSKYGENAIGYISTKTRMGALQALDYAAAQHKASQQLLKTMKRCVEEDAVKTPDGSERLKRFAQKNKTASAILEDACLLEGRRFNTGQHPSGIVISDCSDLSDRTPVQYNNRTGCWMTQMDMSDIEKTGLLKIDLLKLRTLDIITETLNMIKNPVHPDDFPIKESVFQEIFSKGRTIGVFQLESQGMRSLLKQLQPENMEELTFLISLYRPGPLQYAEQIIQGKKSGNQKKYAGAKLNLLFQNTLGYIIYQEQIMRLFHETAGVSLLEADNIRKAVAKKDVQALEPYRERLIAGLLKEKMSMHEAKTFWNELLEFGRYAFNRSHAAAYARLAYITGYLKYYHPREYMCALLNHSEKSKIPILIAECRRLGVQILPPDIHYSESEFTMNGKNEIRFGLSKIKGINALAVDRLLSARLERTFVSLKDFLFRAHEDNHSTDLLIRSGAMDCWTGNRSSLKAWYPKIVTDINSLRKLKGTAQKEAASVLRHRILTNLFVSASPDSRDTTIENEKQTLGCCLSVDPMTYCRHPQSVCKVSEAYVGETRLYGVIGDVKVLKRKKDKREFALFTLKDELDEINAVCFSNVYEKAQEILRKEMVEVQGKIVMDGIMPKLIVEDIRTVEKQFDPVILSVPGISHWLKIKPAITPCGTARGAELYLYDRTGGKAYNTSLMVSEQIYDLQWNDQFYLIEDSSLDDVLVLPEDGMLKAA